MDRWIRDINKPKVNWKRELKKFFNSIFNQKQYGYYNKRYIDRGDYRRGLKKIDSNQFNNVVIAIDTSGSITDDTLNKFGTELKKIFKEHEIDDCYVIWCDADIPTDGVQHFKHVNKKFNLDKLKPTGGGGTSFIPPFQWVEKNLIKKGKIPAFFIYFTDAYGSAPSSSEYKIKKYVKKVMWVITDNDDASSLKFGRKLYIDKILGE